MAVNKVVYGNNTLIDLTSDDVTAEKLITGTKAHDKSGSPITGTNPYEKAATDAEVSTQADLIAQIATALEGKAAGGGSGGSVETCNISIVFNPSSSWQAFYGVQYTVFEGGALNVVKKPVPLGYTMGSLEVFIENVACNTIVLFEYETMGETVTKSGDLVLLGTTSAYSSGSSGGIITIQAQ